MLQARKAARDLQRSIRQYTKQLEEKNEQRAIRKVIKEAAARYSKQHGNPPMPHRIVRFKNGDTVKQGMHYTIRGYVADVSKDPDDVYVKLTQCELIKDSDKSCPEDVLPLVAEGGELHELAKQVDKNTNDLVDLRHDTEGLDTRVRDNYNRIKTQRDKFTDLQTHVILRVPVFSHLVIATVVSSLISVTLACLIMWAVLSSGQVG